MPNVTAKGSVEKVASNPIAKAVRMLFTALYSTSLPVASVPNGCQTGQTNTKTQPRKIASSQTKMAGLHGLLRAVTAIIARPKPSRRTQAATAPIRSHVVKTPTAPVITPISIFRKSDCNGLSSLTPAPAPLSLACTRLGPSSVTTVVLSKS